MNLPSPSSDCTSVPIGGRCHGDCQCSGATPQARCLPIKLGARGGVGLCAIPCEEAADCPDAPPSCGAHASPELTCTAASSCVSDGDCPFDQVCGRVAGGQAC